MFNRGNNRENLFVEERNYDYFLGLYVKHVSRHVNTYAYCLMRNHFHLLIRVPDEDTKGSDRSKRSDPSINATRGLQSLFKAYAMSINKSYGRTGKLFQEHFGRIEIMSESYFTNLVFYIHFNPQKHGFVNDFRKWRWSSYKALCSDEPTQLEREDVLRWFGDKQHYVEFHTGAVNEKLLAGLIVSD